MKAAVLVDYGKPVRLEEIDSPSISDDEALIKVICCGICATDLKIVSGSHTSSNLPQVLGHEPAGIVAGVGRKVNDFRLGDRVAVETRISCGKCWNCRTSRENVCLNPIGRIGFTNHGGFAEYLKAPAVNLIRLPDRVSFEEGAVAVGAISAPYHALKRAGNLLGKNVVVIGVGGLGLHMIQLAKSAGATVIAVDIVEDKLIVAKDQGADRVIDAKKVELSNTIKEMTEIGADVVIEMSGAASAIEPAIACIRLGGELVMVGYSYEKLAIQSASIVQKEITVLGCRSYTFLDLYQVLRLIEHGLIKPVISKRYPLKEINEALLALRKGNIVGRALIFPGE